MSKVSSGNGGEKAKRSRKSDSADLPLPCEEEPAITPAQMLSAALPDERCTVPREVFGGVLRQDWVDRVRGGEKKKNRGRNSKASGVSESRAITRAQRESLIDTAIVLLTMAFTPANVSHAIRAYLHLAPDFVSSVVDEAHSRIAQEAGFSAAHVKYVIHHEGGKILRSDEATIADKHKTMTLWANMYGLLRPEAPSGGSNGSDEDLDYIFSLVREAMSENDPAKLASKSAVLSREIETRRDRVTRGRSKR